VIERETDRLMAPTPVDKAVDELVPTAAP
jgi:hypothetical protein